MLNEFFQTRSIARFRLQAHAYEAREVEAHVFWEGEVELPDALMSASAATCLERWPPCDKLIGEDAHTPDVHTIAIFLFARLYHLRRQVVESATHGLTTI